MGWVSKTNHKDDRRVKGKRTNGVARTIQKDDRRDEYQLKTATDDRPMIGGVGTNQRVVLRRRVATAGLLVFRNEKCLGLGRMVIK